MIYIANAFSLQMLDIEMRRFTNLRISRCGTEAVKALIGSTDGQLPAGYKSIVGHADTAHVISSMLDVAIPFNRESVKLGEDDLLCVCQITGGRLPEGATELPEGAQLSWMIVEYLR